MSIANLTQEEKIALFHEYDAYLVKIMTNDNSLPKKFELVPYLISKNVPQIIIENILELLLEERYGNFGRVMHRTCDLFRDRVLDSISMNDYLNDLTSKDYDFSDINSIKPITYIGSIEEIRIELNDLVLSLDSFTFEKFKFVLGIFDLIHIENNTLLDILKSNWKLRGRFTCFELMVGSLIIDINKNNGLDIYEKFEFIVSEDFQFSFIALDYMRQRTSDNRIYELYFEKNEHKIISAVIEYIKESIEVAQIDSESNKFEIHYVDCTLHAFYVVEFNYQKSCVDVSELCEKDKNEIIVMLESFPLVYRLLSKEQMYDIDIAKAAISGDVTNHYYIPKNLYANPDFMKFCILYLGGKTIFRSPIFKDVICKIDTSKQNEIFTAKYIHLLGPVYNEFYDLTGVRKNVHTYHSENIEFLLDKEMSMVMSGEYNFIKYASEDLRKNKVFNLKVITRFIEVWGEESTFAEEEYLEATPLFHEDIKNIIVGSTGNRVTLLDAIQYLTQAIELEKMGPRLLETMDAKATKEKKNKI